ncbi:MAG: helix-turn-helix domain-containing protein [Bacteroidales bacterium]|jgi:transcriptional regulator with XRE-family HTH domain|nr:helix-turn-helix domain-containing protein [Bacteroidales bacterium]
MDYNRIKTELDRRGMSIRDLCYKIDITEQGLHQMIRNKSMKVEVLERISQVLGCPVSYWFTEDSSVCQNTDVNDAEQQVIPNIIHQKIDTLTNDLNDMLKDLLSTQQKYH